MNRREVLETAIKCVTGEREVEHGNPENTFLHVAELWSIYLSESISPADVCNMMVLLKVARSAENPNNEDNYIDMAGYASLAGELAGKNT